MIDYVEIDGEGVRLAGREYPEFFAIDSMAALIGVNGSGKTRLLKNLAEVLSGGAEIGGQGRWEGTDRFGVRIGGDIKEPPPQQGVIYYTPLPYRRAIAPHPHLFDASEFGGHLSRSRSYRHFLFITELLGIETQLVGRLIYRDDIFRRLIVPRLLEGDCWLIDPVMESRRAQLMASLNYGGSGASDDTELENFAKSIELWCRDNLKNSNQDATVALACLEHDAKQLRQRAQAVKNFLSFTGVADFKDSSRDRYAGQAVADFERFKRLIDTTSTFLEKTRASEIRSIAFDGKSGYEVEFNYHGSPRRIGSRAGAFDIGWDNLSSGLLSLVEQFTRLELGLERLRRHRLKSVLILIDEGDAFLHLDWQRQYIFHLDRFLGQLKRNLGFDCLQVLLATHSPIISGDFPSMMVQRIGGSSGADAKTFGSSLDALVLETFGTASIGEFAARKLMDLRARFVMGRLDASDRSLIEEIGDEGLRRAIISEPEGKE